MYVLSLSFKSVKWRNIVKCYVLTACKLSGKPPGFIGCIGSTSGPGVCAHFYIRYSQVSWCYKQLNAWPPTPKSIHAKTIAYTNCNHTDLEKMHFSILGNLQQWPTHSQTRRKSVRREITLCSVDAPLILIDHKYHRYDWRQKVFTDDSSNQCHQII